VTRDERGTTLTELLAAMTITMIVLAVAFSVYYAIHNATTGGMERYMDKSAMNGAMNRLAAELADATTVYVSAAGDEIRMTNGSGARAIVFDAEGGTLTLYAFSEGESPAGKLANVTDAAIRLATRPELYARPRELPAVVEDIRLYNAQGVPVAGVSVGGGAVVRLAVTFVTSDGPRAVETAVKLFHASA